MTFMNETQNFCMNKLKHNTNILYLRYSCNHKGNYTTWT